MRQLGTEDTKGHMSKTRTFRKENIVPLGAGWRGAAAIVSPDLFVGGPRMLPGVLNGAFPSARIQEPGLGRRVAHTRHRDHGYGDY